MYVRGMSAWNAAELEDIDWDVFGRSDDHIVPYQGVELFAESSASGYAQKKPRHALKDDVGKNMCSTGFSTKAVFSGEEATCPHNGSSFILEGSRSHKFNVVVPILRDLETTANTTAIPSHNIRVLDSCLNEANNIPQNATSLSSVENDQKARNNDLAYYDWPDISNFEDIDKMFRNWDSTFGQDQAGTTDELTWFSSSTNAIYGSEIAFDPGFQSPSSDLSMLRCKVESHCPNANLLPKNVSVTAGHNRPTSSNYADLLGTDASLKAKAACKEKVEIQHTSEDKRTQISPDQMLLDVDASASQIYSSKQRSQENHFVGSSSSSYITNLDPYIRIEFGLPVHQLPFTPVTSSFEIEQGTNPSSSYKISDHVVNQPIQCLDRLPDQLYIPQATADKEDIDKIYQRQQLCGRMTPEQLHSPFCERKSSVQKEPLEIMDDTELEDVGLEPPMVERVHPTSQESSGMTSVSSDDISEKVTSFQQLRDVMYQLDVRTKLCIRDSLYRLARSARERHAFTLQDCGEGAIDTKGIPGAEASQRSAEFMNVETNTNPIDRSIALLLYHKPSEPAMMSADTKSLESAIMVGGPITNRI